MDARRSDDERVLPRQWRRPREEQAAAAVPMQAQRAVLGRDAGHRWREVVVVVGVKVGGGGGDRPRRDH